MISLSVQCSHDTSACMQICVLSFEGKTEDQRFLLEPLWLPIYLCQFQDFKSCFVFKLRLQRNIERSLGEWGPLLPPGGWIILEWFTKLPVPLQGQCTITHASFFMGLVLYFRNGLLCSLGCLLSLGFYRCITYSQFPLWKDVAIDVPILLRIWLRNLMLNWKSYLSFLASSHGFAPHTMREGHCCNTAGLYGPMSGVLPLEVRRGRTPAPAVWEEATVA